MVKGGAILGSEFLMFDNWIKSGGGLLLIGFKGLRFKDSLRNVSGYNHSFELTKSMPLFKTKKGDYSKFFFCYIHVVLFEKNVSMARKILRIMPFNKFSHYRTELLNLKKSPIFLKKEGMSNFDIWWFGTPFWGVKRGVWGWKPRKLRIKEHLGLVNMPSGDVLGSWRPIKINWGYGRGRGLKLDPQRCCGVGLA